jgi:hypothetical protein
MSRTARLTRKSYFVDPRMVRRARKVLGVATEAETIRVAVERVTEMEMFWRWMRKSRRSLRPGSFETR